MSPFDSARFAVLSKGLDVTIVPLAEVKGATGKLRLDSKYFGRVAVTARRLVDAWPGFRLESVASVVRKGIFDIKAESYTRPGEGVPFVRVSDLKGRLVRGGETAWISREAHNREIKTGLRRGDLVLSKTAYPAAALVVTEECNVSQDVIAVKLSTEGKKHLKPEYVVAFLNSSLGMALMGAEFQGNVQEHFALPDAKGLHIPSLGASLQSRIKGAFETAMAEMDSAVSMGRDADAAFYKSLGLEGWSPPQALTYQGKASDVGDAGRLDADYFAPRIRELAGALARSGEKIGDVASPRKERFDSEIAGSCQYIEIGSLSGEGTAESVVVERAEAPTRATWHVHAGDIITSMVRPNRRLSALIDDVQDGYVCSSGFVVLEPVGVPSEVLLTYLRLPVVCELMDLHTSASMYPAISERNLLGLPFAGPDPETERLICDAVHRGRQSRAMAWGLLTAASTAVELAVEKGDASAHELLDGLGG